jgi:hypothetical protein
MTLLPDQSVHDTQETPKTGSGEGWRGYGARMVPRWNHRKGVPAILRSEKVPAFETLLDQKLAPFLHDRFILDTPTLCWSWPPLLPASFVQRPVTGT